MPVSNIAVLNEPIKVYVVNLNWPNPQIANLVEPYQVVVVERHWPIRGMVSSAVPEFVPTEDNPYAPLLYGQYRGIAVDDAGNPLPNIKVSVFYQDTKHRVCESTTNEKGEFIFDGLHDHEGEYTIYSLDLK